MVPEVLSAGMTLINLLGVCLSSRGEALSHVLRSHTVDVSVQSRVAQDGKNPKGFFYDCRN